MTDVMPELNLDDMDGEFATFSEPPKPPKDIDPEIDRLSKVYNGVFTQDELPDELYFRLRRLSKSRLDIIARSPLHYEWQVLKGNWPHPTPNMALGSAVHCAVLEPAKFAEQYIAMPKFDRRTKAGKAAAENFVSLAAFGKKVISQEQWQTATGIAEAIKNQHPWLHTLINEGGDPEVSVLWTDDFTANRCKGKLDFLSADKRVVLDLKTTQECKKFPHSVADYRYHVQEAFYRDGLLGNDIALDLFVFVAVETTAPFLVQVYQLDRAAVDQGREQYHEDIALLGNCLVNNCWPGIPDVTTIGLPRWAMTVPKRR